MIAFVIVSPAMKFGEEKAWRKNTAIGFPVLSFTTLPEPIAAKFDRSLPPAFTARLEKQNGFKVRTGAILTFAHSQIAR